MDDLAIRGNELTLELLEKHPVWGSFEGDDSDIIRPVKSEEPFTVDCDPLTIKANLLTPNGRSLAGCIVVDRSDDTVYLVEILIDGRYYGFNVALPDIAESQLMQLQEDMGSVVDPI